MQERCWIFEISLKEQSLICFLGSVPQRNLTKTSMLEVGSAVCCFPSSALFAIRSVTFAFPFILVRR